MTPSVLWPSDVAGSGFCYGWNNPEVCVAGVLEVEDVGSMFMSWLVVVDSTCPNRSHM